MTGRLNLEKTSIVLLVSLVSLFVIFVVYWEGHKLAQNRSALHDNAQVIARSLWNLDPHGPVAYLKLAARHQNHERVTVFTVTDKVFMETTGPKCGLVDMALKSIGLISRITLHADIVHQGRVIGRIEAIHRHTTIYLYFYILLILGLFLMVARLYMRTVEAKNILEDRVTERTQELVGANQGLQQEINERKEAEKALATEQERLAVTLRSIGDGVITTDIEGNIVLINKIAEKLTGWNQEDAAGKPLSEVFHIINERTGKRCENPVDKVLENGKIVALANHTALIAKDGSKCSIADSGAPIRDKQSEIIGVVLVFRDVTVENRKEEELAKGRKLESVGLLAGGIAHDFNNILTAILGNINLALLDTNPDDKNHFLLQEAEKASLRARKLTQQLLTFAKGGEPVKELAAIKDIIQDSANFVLRGSNVRCNFHCNDDLWPVEIDQGQVSQVIQNIIINANQAMPEGGIVEVNCTNISLAQSKSLNLRPQDYIKISIEDCGIGIASSLLDKIFDPYFTTKQQGSGLGLAVSHSIISKHNGYITADSEPGVGTTFTLYLPAEKDKQLALHSTQEAGNELLGQGRILIMDDDKMVRTVSQSMLSHLGYDVLLAENGDEALSLYREALATETPINLTIMDLTIPGGMGGQEAVIAIHEIDLEAKVIVSSGYSNDPIMANYKDYGFIAAIIKPFQLQDLKEVVRRIL
jgi:PAS domain S-box-containing protein